MFGRLLEIRCPLVASAERRTFPLGRIVWAAVEDIVTLLKSVCEAIKVLEGERFQHKV